jgi:hypothetical protein
MPVEAPRDRTQEIPADLQLLQKQAPASAFSLIAATRETLAQSRELMRRIDEILGKR